MARKKGGRIKTMADAKITEMQKKGPGYVSKKSTSGQIVGVDMKAKGMRKCRKK